MNINYNIFAILIIYGFSLNAGRYSDVARRAAVLTDVYFCAKMSNGEQISNGIDDYLWTGLGCDEVIEKAISVGCTESDIVEQVNKARGVGKKNEIRNIDTGENSDESIDWIAFERNLEVASEKAVIATNLHFCVKMSNGEEISNGVDNFLWESMGCDKIIERAFEFGFKKEEVIKIINEAKQPEMLKDSSGDSSFDLEEFKRDLKASLKRGREEFEQKYSAEIKEMQESSEKIVRIYKRHGLID